MKELMKSGNKRMTLKEVAEITGAAYSTIAAYAQKAGWTQNGKQTLLNEKQVTVILEAMKTAQPNQTKDTFQAGLEGIETSQSLYVQTAIAEREARIAAEKVSRLWKKIAEGEKQRADIAECERDMERADHNGTKRILAFQMQGNKHNQSMLEAAGIIKSDKEDVIDTYRR